MDREKQKYRVGVGIVLLNKDNNIFVGERIDHPGAWQMPQGGIDQGENLEQAFFRELLEETGTDKAEILRVHDIPFRYELPDHLRLKLWDGKYRGQEQHWIISRFTGTDNDINIHAHRHAEFGSWKWIELDKILDMIVPFKRQTYENVLEAFDDLLRLV